MPGYNYFKKLTTQEIEISVGTANLTNFPVLVRLTDTSTWDANFKAAYHLHLSQADVTSNGNNLGLVGTPSNTLWVAANGKDLFTTDNMNCPCNNGICTNGDLTLDTWIYFKTLQASSNDNVLISCGAPGNVGAPDNMFYSFNFVGAGANINKLRIYWEYGTGGLKESIVSTSSVAITVGNWHHFSVTRDFTNSLVTFYVDGIQLGTSVSYVNAPAGGSTTNFQIGERQENVNHDIDGDLDEIRISNSVRNAEWMQATVQSERIGSTFIVYNTTSCVPPDISVAGTNQTICATSATMAANTPTAGIGTWSLISGTGTITNSLSPTTGITALGLGDNVFEWTITSGTCTSVSDVTITVNANPTTATAGSNQTICINSPTTTLNGNNPAVGTGTWSVISGTATITSPNLNNTTVTGLGLGITQLQWAIGNGVCANSTSTVAIQVDPATSIATAGPSQTICITTNSTTLAANTPTTGTGSWSVVSGSAVFTNSNNPTTTISGLSLGINVLQWTITSAGTCSSTSSTMTIQVDPATSIASAGPSQTICITTNSTTLAANTPTTGTGSWSVVSGSAVFTNSNSPTSAVSGLSLGINILQWNITSAGTCSSTSSTMTIQVDPATSIANAGPSQTVCITANSTTLAANTPTTGTGSWSVVSGSAVFTNSNNPTTTVSGLALGINVLQWTITSAGTCSSTSSTMSIQVDPATSIATAGPSQTICITTNSTTLAANTPTMGIGTWSVVSGSAVFTNSNSPTSAVSGLSLGINILQWNITSAGTCSSTSSTMTIQVDPATSIANAGPSQTVCITANSTTLAANTPTTGTGSWSVVSGSAVFTNSNNPTTTVGGLTLGINVLQWTITSAGTCSSTSSTMTIQVDPATSIATAGPSQTVCITTNSTTLAANTPTTGVGTWAVVSGSAVITNSNNPNTTVTGLGLGPNVLQWNITSAGTCSSTTSTMTIQVDPATSIATAGPSQTVCITTNSTTLSANTPTTGTGSWLVVSGSAVFTNSNSPTSAVSGLSLGINILQWNVTSAGTCSSTSSTMTIQVDPATSIANAGPSQTVCITANSTTLAANTPTTGTGSWSVIAGSAVFTNSNNPTTTVTGLGLGPNVLQWTITSAGTCSSTSSTMTIQVDPATSIASAGPSQTICITTNSTTLAANTPTTGTGSWSVVSGSAVFTNSNSPTSAVSGLSLGINILQWNITSAGTCSSTSSTMTIQVDPATSIANAGPSQTVCITANSTTLAANTPTTGTGSWSVVSGSAVFTNSNNPTTTVSGLSLGINVLQWTITSAGTCSSTSSTMTIQVDPATSIANAGPSQTVCITTNSTTLAANTPTTGTGSWSVVSGSAVFTNSNNPTTTVSGLSLGPNVLQWNITSAGTCSSTSSTMTIQVDPATSISNAGPSQTLCVLNPTTTLAANTPTTGVGTWSVISGSAVITSPTNPNTTVTSVALGINILQWNITSPGTCSSTASTMTIQVDPATSIANAGPSQTVCITANSTTLAANTPTTGIGTWSVVSGSAVFTNSNSPTTIVSGLSLGINVLQWTITSAGTCSSTSSTMTIQVDPATSIATAGSSQTVCITTNSTTLAANTPTTGAGSWSVVSGSAVFTNSNNPTTMVSGLSLGPNVLQWNITSAGTCSSTSSTMTIQVDPATSIANAGPSQTICVTTNSTTLAANTPTTGTGSWSVVSGSAVFTNSNNPTTTVSGLSLGVNVLQWNITSAGTCSSTSSTMTIQVDPATSIANAGPSQTICITTNSTTLAANTPTTGAGSWSVISGSAVFTNSNSPATTVSGLSLGINVLQWNITSAGTCSSTSSTMTIQVDPATSIANAGPSQTVCITTNSTTLAANTPTTGTGSWSVVSGSAVFTNSNSPTSAVSGLSLGINVLQWTITSAGTCSSTSSTMTIQVDPATSIANAGPSQTICVTTNSTTLAANTPTTGTGSWSVVSGSAVFTNSNNPTTTVSGLSLGINVLQWTITSAGTCSSTSSTMTIQVDPATSIATAGPSQTICVTTNSTTLAANTPTTGAGSWSVVSGSAVFTNSNSPTSAVSGLSLGINVLQWTITSAGTCSSTSSTMTIQVDPATSVANAGPSQTICITTNSTTLAANTPTTGTGSWSVVSGSAVFTNSNSPTSAVSGLSLGINVLQWTITSAGTCSSTSSTMTIQVDPATSIATAGPSQTICITTNSTTLAANTPTTGAGSWSVVSGSAVFTNSNSPATTVGGLALGINVLQWTITSAGTCSSTSSTMTIQVDPATSIATAGPSQTICVTTNSTTLAANTPTTGTGSWSVVSGSAVFINSNSPATAVSGLSLGINVLQWTITSAGTCSSTSSTMTIQVDPATSIANAGPSQTICITTNSTTLAANTPTTGAGSWSVVSGSAVFTNSNNPTTTVSGLSLGPNVLQWNITSAGTCSSTSSTMTIQVDPATSISNAGPSQTLCVLNPTTTLAANTPTTGVGTWSVISGSAVITSPTNPNTTVTSVALGINILQWNITSPGTCSSTASTMTIQVDPAPSIANAGPSQTLCILNPTTALAGNTPTSGIGTWSITSGSGIITNSNSPNSTVTNLGLGINVLQWSITNNGACPQTVSTVTIQVDPAPSIANAGPSQTLCILNPTTNLAANTPTSGIGTWSVISGSAVITNSNNPNTTVTGVGLGNNVLQWSIVNNGVCPQTISTMTIVVNPAPSIANAGSNQTICISSPSTTLAGNTPTTGVGTWSIISGSGTITSPNNPNTTVTGVGLGINVLQWSITNNGVCPQTVSTVTIQVDPAPSIANAGPNQTVCISSPNTTMAGNTPTTGVGTWSIISGSGTITNPNNPNTTVTGLGLGINILQWSIANGVCATTGSTMSIQVDNVPTIASAGSSQTLCISNPSLTMAGNIPTVGTGLWTFILGSGTITTPNSGTTTITNLGLGQNIFAWTISNGVCAASVSNIVITIDPLPSIAVAGPNQTICISSPTTILSGNTPTSGVGTWSVITGSGNITSINTPTTTVTNLGLGINVLQWTITNNGACPQTTSTMTIQVDPATSIANAGPSQTVCITTNSTTLAANTPTTGTGSWSVVSGSAVFTNSNNPTTTVTGLGLGPNILQWTITSAGTCSSTSSTMTIQVDPATSIANAGPSQTVCITTNSTTLAANTPTTGTGSWSVVSGSAVFTNFNNPTTTVNGLSLGINVLQWSITSAGTCSSTASTMTIQVDPATSIANAGPSQTVCITTNSTTLAANTPTTGTGSWSVVSGSAVFTNSNNPTTTVNGLSLGINVLQWNITSAGTCSSTASTMTIQVDPAPSIANAGPSQTLCILNPTTTLAANTPTSGIGTWSVIIGSAVITNSNNPNTTVTGVGLGTNVLQWSITNNGACPLTVSTMTIHVDPAPSIALAGSNQTLCILSPTTTLAANTPTSGVGTWSVVSGSAIFNNANNPTTTVTGLSLGTNILQWSITNNGACPLTSATMTIQVNPAPSIANAGPSQTLCILNPTTTLAANTPTSGIGTWSVIIGSAVITNSNNPNTTVTGVGLGTNVLQWSITNNGACPLTSSNMTIVVDPAPSISVAGPNQTVCISSPTAILSGNTPTSGIGTWSVVGGSGTVTNPNLPNTTVTNLGLGIDVLAWTITNNGACPQTGSALTIQVDPAPSIANAGPNQIICISSPSTAMAANTPTTGVGTWSVISGSAVITNSNNPNTTITGVGLGINVLQWRIANGVCPTTISTVTIQVDPLPSIANAGPNQTICISSPSTTLAGNTPTTGVGTWSIISGSGTITSPNNPNTTVTGLGLGINVLKWSIANGVCATTGSTMSIQVDNVPTVASAGPSQTLCISNPSLTMVGNSPTVGTGLWSLLLGSGTITTPTLGNTTVTGLGLGQDIFSWTISNGVCAPSVSNIVITIDPLPSAAVAGSNQTVCISSPTTILNGNNPAVGTGTWTVISGTGTVTSVNSPTTPIGNLSLGTNIIQWNVGTVGCAPTISTLSIQVDQVPTIANAGPNQTLCVNNPTTTLNANNPAVGVGSWSVIAGGGNISNTLSPTSPVTALPTGTNVLQWTIVNGVCAPSISTMSIQVDNNTIFAYAGPNQTLCAASPSTTMAGNTPTVGNGTWVLLVGSGTIATPSLANTAVTNLGTGTNIFQWTVINGVCSFNSSVVFIYVVPSPGVPNAGPSQTLCISNPTTIVSANTPSLGTASWSLVSGAANIVTPASNTTQVLSLGVGNNILAWTMTYSVCSLTSTLNLHVDNIPSVPVAGPNQTLCISSPTTIMAANTPTSGAGSWSLVSGTGVITTPTLANSTVTGLGLGINVFKWTINGGGCGTSSSTMSIQVDNLPTTAIAGANQTLCISSPTTILGGNTPVAGTGNWSVIAGSGSVTTPTMPNSPVTGLGLGLNTLQWTISNGACISSSTMNIQVDNVPTISNAGPSQSLCVSSATAVLAGNTPLVGSGTWSVLSGTAAVVTPTLATSNVTGIAIGINVLQWTISNGVCAASSSTTSIEIDPVATPANAGPNQTLCISSPSTTLAGNSVTVGVGTWSVISGSGTITNSLLPNSTVTNLGLGPNVLQWTIASGACGATSSTMSIQVDDVPTISNAGANQTLCISAPTTVLTGNTALLGIGSWSVISGSAVITTPTLETSAVTSIGTGVNILQWTIANGACGTSTSTMSIQVDQLPTMAIASPNQTTCITNPTVTITGNVPTVGTGIWTLFSGSGTIASASSATTAITGLGVGIDVFAWTISNGVCASSTATTQILVDPLPTAAAAGPNQILCITNPNAVMAANNAVIGTGSWSVVSGSGTIANNNSETTAITSLGLGVNVFAWTITNNCSSSTSTVSITIDQVPTTAIATANQTLCISSPSTTINGNVPAVGTGVWTLISGTGTITSPGSAITSVTNLAIGINVFEWTIANGGCPPSAADVTITVDPSPTIANAGPNQTLCISNPNAVMAANNAAVGTGSWSVVSGSGTIANINSETTAITNLGAGLNVFAWTIYSSCGSSTSTVSIQVDQAPTTAVAAANQTICISTASATINGNVPAVGTGIWTVVAGSGTITSPGSAVTTVTNLAIGNNVFEWTISNGGCTPSVADVTITVDPAPTIANAGPNQTLCISSPNTIMAANTVAVGTGSWSVVSGSGTIANINSEITTITSLGLGLNVFAWTIYSSCGSSTSTISIQVDQAPSIATASSNQTLCITTPTVTINGNIPTIGTGGWTLISGGGAITSPTSAITTVTNLAVGINIFEWAISNGACPASVADVTITVDPLPTTAAAGPNQTVCISSGATMAANTAAVGTGSWSVVSGSGTITSINLETTTITNLGLGNNVFAWTIYSSCGSSSSNVTITVNQLPTTALASPNQTLCYTAPSTTITGNTPAIGTGLWTLIAGSGAITSPGSASTTITGLAVGSNIFEWAITNGVCPPSVADVTITVDPLPTIASAGSNQTVCISSGAVMTANPPAVGSGSWSVVSGSGVITSSTSANTSITSLGAGVNVFAWTIYNNCSSSVSNVTITADQLPTTAIAGVDQDLCAATSSTLNANNPAVGTGSWSVIAGGSSVTSPGLNTSAVSGLTTGTNILVWSVTNGLCPASTSTVNIVIDAIPTIANAGPDQTGCATAITLNGNNPLIGVGVWSVIAGGSSVSSPTQNNSGVSGLTTGTNVLAWSISNGACPVSTDTVVINVLPATPPAVAGNDTTISVNQVNLHGNNPSSGTGLWTLVSGSGNIVNPVNYNSQVTSIAPGPNTFRWTITGVCGTTSADVKITLLDTEMPNGVSPNGDGVNDTFIIPFITGYKNVEIKILNRWGNLEYETTNYNNDWGGLNQSGNPLAEDTYFYILKLDNLVKTGYITLKR